MRPFLDLDSSPLPFVDCDVIARCLQGMATVGLEGPAIRRIPRPPKLHNLSCSSMACPVAVAPSRSALWLLVHRQQADPAGKCSRDGPNLEEFGPPVEGRIGPCVGFVMIVRYRTLHLGDLGFIGQQPPIFRCLQIRILLCFHIQESYLDADCPSLQPAEYDPPVIQHQAPFCPHVVQGTLLPLRFHLDRAANLNL